MSAIDRDILLQALSVLTGVTVKPYTDFKSRSSSLNELNIYNYLSTVFGSEYSLPASAGAFALRSFTIPNQRELFVNMEQFFDQQHDFDFRCAPDTTSASRGGESYYRPWGWYRYALKVLDKYPDGNAWLGSPGWRNHSSPGEWPVSFHGTSIEGAEGIVKTHFKTGPRQLYGRGIYSTPDIREARQYATDFTFKSKTYRVIMQNRINPSKRMLTKRKNYWLIPIPDGYSQADEKAVVEASIRPYGILIKEM